jgi:hypothetical protein
MYKESEVFRLRSTSGDFGVRVVNKRRALSEQFENVFAGSQIPIWRIGERAVHEYDQRIGSG